MPTNVAAPSSPAAKKAHPPTPAMFRLNPPAPVDDDGKKTSEGSGDENKTRWPSPPPATTTTTTPAVTSGDVPSVKPAAKSNMEASSSMDQKPSSQVKQEQKSNPKEADDAGNESDKDSIAGEINPPIKIKSPENVPGRSSNNGPAKKAAATKAPSEKKTVDEKDKETKKTDTSYLDDSDEDDEKPKLAVKAAIKRPRNSASAEAYAKRMAEKAAAQGQDSEGNEEKPDIDLEAAKMAVASGIALIEGESTTITDSTTKKEDTKHNPKVQAKDTPPRKVSTRVRRSTAKAAAAAEAAEASGKLKSPPEQMVQKEEPKTKRGSSAKKSTGGNLKSPPEEMKEVALPKRTKKEASPRGGASKARGAAKKASPSNATAAKDSPPKKGMRQSKRKATEVAKELVSNLEDVAESPSPAKDVNKEDEKDNAAVAVVKEESPARRSKRARKQTELLSMEVPKKPEDDGDLKPAATVSSPKKRKASPAKAKASKSPASPTKKKPKVAAAAKKSSPRSPALTEYLESKMTSTWNERIAMLKSHREIYNSCDLTLAPKDSVPALLKSFVLESRKQYKKFQRKEHSTLTAARITQLEELGFDFDPMNSGSSKSNHDRRFQKAWDEQFEALERYKAEHGDCLVSCMTKGPLTKLGNWVRGQRKLYNKVGRSGFNPQRLAKLDAIGFDWDPMRSGSFMAKKRANMFPRVDANWNKHFAKLLEYKKEHGNIVVGPTDEKYHGLYDWIHCQRKEYKKFKAGDTKALMYNQWVDKLDELGFVWAPMKSDGFGKMLLEKQSKHFNAMWHKHYGELQEFKKKHGHCYVSRCGKDEALASWIHVQRKHKRKNDTGKESPLTPERIKLLEDLGIDWAPSVSGGMLKITQVSRDKDWEAVFQKLVSFQKKHGHANPKKVEPQLGPWCCRMRKLYAKNANGETTTLTDKKIAKLESIGFKFVSDRTTTTAPVGDGEVQV